MGEENGNVEIQAKVKDISLKTSECQDPKQESIVDMNLIEYFFKSVFISSYKLHDTLIIRYKM